MMIALLNCIDSTTRFAKFSISSVNELNLLPTCTRRGAQGTPAGSIMPICAGSLAQITDSDSDIYILNGDTDTWVKMSRSGGGGGGGDDEPLTPEQIANIINIING